MSSSTGPGILAGAVEDHRRRHPSARPEIDATQGLEVVHAASGRRGTVVTAAKGAVTLRLANDALVTMRLSPGAFRIDGRPVSLRVPSPTTRPSTPSYGPSGSVTAPTSPKVAAPSRIWVEGVHDAELLEKIWGDDLRHIGVVVEPLHGMDDLVAAVEDFGPTPERRLGILLDHLVPGTKESFEAERMTKSLGMARANVLVVGHPFVDVWEAVKPDVVGITAWPTVPRGLPWKKGVCQKLNVGEPAAFWRRVLDSVESFTDLDVSLINAVERLIDFTEGA